MSAFLTAVPYPAGVALVGVPICNGPSSREGQARRGPGSGARANNLSNTFSKYPTPLVPMVNWLLAPLSCAPAIGSLRAGLALVLVASIKLGLAVSVSV